MGSQVKRRYTATNKLEYPIYSETFDQLLIESKVLNSGDQIPNAHTVIWDERNIIAAIRELEGDGDGSYWQTNNERVSSVLKQTRARLSELENQFAHYCDRHEAQGRERPEVWPSTLLEERLRTEAKMDVTLRELETLKIWLRSFTDREQEVRNDKVLAYGPLGAGRLHNGELCEIDGQRVELRDTVMVITEPSSPYCGMAVKDYRKLSDAWVRARNEHRQALAKQRSQEIKEKGTSSIVVPLGVRKVSRTSLPPWPSDVKNYLLQPEETQEQQR